MTNTIDGKCEIWKDTIDNCKILCENSTNDTPEQKQFNDHMLRLNDELDKLKYTISTSDDIEVYLKK